jgi:protein-tyrosine phosphatase
MYRFASASQVEPIVFGAAKPGSERQVSEWVQFMHQQGIQRVCCLLPQEQLTPYSDLLGIYRREFGEDKVLWAPIKDFHLVETETLTQKVLPFLAEAEQQQEKVVVHCSGGVGRTGHVLAAWLVFRRGLSNQEAIAAVKKTGRNPYEAAIAGVLMGKNPWQGVSELNSLLNACCRPNSE